MFIKILFFQSLFALIILINWQSQVLANNALNIYMNDFYTKSNEASRILKEIEINLKEGSRKKVCMRQREAARLGLLANKSLIKAFELESMQPPMKEIKASQERWESILNEC